MAVQAERRSLEVIFMSLCHIRDTNDIELLLKDPNTLNSLQKLRIASHFRHTDHLTDLLCGAPNLEELSMVGSTNDEQHIIYAGVAKLKQLRRLHIAYPGDMSELAPLAENQTLQSLAFIFSGYHDKDKFSECSNVVSKLQSLESLTCSFEIMSPTYDWAFLSSLTELQTLILSNTRNFDSPLPTSLRNLALNGDVNLEAAPHLLAPLTNLKSLSITLKSFTGLPETMNKLTNLESLLLQPSSVSLRDVDISKLTKLTKLTILCEQGPNFFESLQHCRDLNSLTLYQSNHIRLDIVGSLPLQRLIFIWAMNSFDQLMAVMDLAEQLKDLVHFQCTLMSSKSFTQPECYEYGAKIAKLGHVSELVLPSIGLGNQHLAPYFFSIICKHLPHFKVLKGVITERDSGLTMVEYLKEFESLVSLETVQSHRIWNNVRRHKTLLHYTAVWSPCGGIVPFE